MPRPTLLAVSHGTSDATGAAHVNALVTAVQDALPDVAVIEAFVDVQQPDAAQLAPTLDGPLVIVPLLLSGGFHVHHDLHSIARTRPDTVVAAPLGPDVRLARVLAARLSADARCDVILTVAGSRDPRAAADAESMATLLHEQLGRDVHLAYLAAAQPDLPTALAQHPDAEVASYLLAHGYFYDLASHCANGRSLSEPLLNDGTVPRDLVELVVARYESAVAAHTTHKP